MDFVRFFLVLCISFMGINQVLTLRCLKCFSYDSMADCMTSVSVVKCSSDYNRCSNTTVQIHIDIMKETITGYQLGCAKETECQQKTCPRHFALEMGKYTLKKCDIMCCSRDLCPLLPNATLRPPEKTGPVKGARGGVGTVTFVHVYLWVVIIGVFSLLF